MRRGTVSLFANTTNIPDLSREDVFAEVQTRASYPKRMLPSFLHESTHHWCFRSPVGNALALARLRVAQEVAVAVSEKTDLKKVEAPLFAYTLCEVMLRPLIEGLALFAEFDMLPEHETKVASLLSQNVGLFFRENDSPDRDPTDLIREPLIEMRKSVLCAQRKATVYLASSSLDSDGYLLGYVAIKQVWLAATHAYPRFRDTELFLLFTRSYIFADHELAIQLLEPADDLNVLLSTLAARVHDRLRDMVRLDLATIVPQFEATVEGLSSSRVGHDFSEDVPWDSKDRRARFHRLVEDFQLGRPGGGEQRETFGVIGAKLLATRNLMTIGRLPARIDLASRSYDVFDEKDREVQEADAKAAGDVIGEVRYYLLPAYHCHLVLLKAQGKIIDLRVIGVLPEHMNLDDAAEWLSDIDSAHGAFQATEQLTAYAAETYADELEMVRSFAKEQGVLMYEHYTFLNGTIDRAARDKIGNEGLWAIFEADPQFIFDTARLSNLLGAGRPPR